MKLNSAQIERTLHQFDAQAIPAEHPAVPKLEQLFGDHTYFLDNNGLSIVEPVEAEQGNDNGNGRHGVVVILASWADRNAASLEPHEPEPTELVVDLESDLRH